MKKILLDKGHADYAKMPAALSEIKLALEQNDFRSAVSALMLANDKAAGGVLSAKKTPFQQGRAKRLCLMKRSRLATALSYEKCFTTIN